MKKCFQCGAEKPSTNEYFYRDKSTKDGLKSGCKTCRNAKSKLYKETHKEVLNEQSRIYHHANKERLNLAQRLYYLENKERLYAYRQGRKEERAEVRHKYEQSHKAEILATKRIWGKKNIDKVRVKTQRYRAKKRNLPHTLTDAQWQEIKSYFHGRCAYCGEEKPLAQDHVRPVFLGGEYTHNNVVCSCRECNSSKGFKSLEEWYPKFKHYSPEREQKILSCLGYKNGVQQLSLM